MPTSPTDEPPPPPAPPADVAAVAKHACAACGAQAEWNPARQALICPHCGTEGPGELDRATGQVREIDLLCTLRELPDERRGWQTDRRAVRCRSCNAVSVFEPGRVGQACEFCGSAELVDYQEIRAPIRPESVLPFQVAETQVRERFRAWCASKWLAPRSFKRRALVDTVRGVYLPYWTFDAQVFCRWSAEAGTYYNTTESHRGADGRVRTRQVRHVRWRPAGGSLEHFFDDEPVPGSRGVDRRLLRAIEPFPTDQLVPYDTGYLSGFVVEHYQVVLVAAAQEARRSMEAQLRQLCIRQIPGDTYRNLEIRPDFSGQTFKLGLVPLWISTYVYRGKPYQLLANGHTGRLAGHYPKSVWKLLALAAFAAAAISLIALYVR